MENPVSLSILEHRFSDGAINQWRLFMPDACERVLVWMPALGVAARNYDRWAQAWARQSVGVALVECRGNGASSLRASRRVDFGYHEVLEIEMPEMMAVLRQIYPQKRWWLCGHILCGQLATLYNALDGGFERLLLVGTGAPWYRCYGSKGKYYYLLIQMARLLTEVLGYYPGQRLKFGGNEGRRCVRDWSHSALTGQFVIGGSALDVEQRIAQVITPVLSIWFQQDPLISVEGWQYLLDKMPRAEKRVETMGSPPLQVPADHFAWMKAPAPVVEALLKMNKTLNEAS